MAIYEYDCRKCGTRIEVMQPMGSEPLERCGDECVAAGRPGDGPVERAFSLVNVGGSARSAAPMADDPSCGRCGRVGPDVCGA